MNKKELVTSVSEKTGISKSDTRKTLEAIIEAVSAEMQKNEKIIIYSRLRYVLCKRQGCPNEHSSSDDAALGVASKESSTL